MMKYAWIIPLLPLASFLFNLLLGKKLKAISAYVSIALLSVDTLLAIVILFARFTHETYRYQFHWLKLGENSLSLGIEVNQLNALMLFIVTAISLIVHIYSKGYMAKENRFPVFYAYLGLFTAGMLGLVLSPNLIQLYMFWEMVGVGSFLLIGFYYYKDEARRAAQKAFLMTRIGDVGLLVGILYIFSKTGTFTISEIYFQIENGAMTQLAITVAALLIFAGAIGKSAQFPLHTWLPDAMEGPTPASALIHAATMVAAGVYLVATMYPLFVASKVAMLVVGIVGGFTAIFAASIALVQKDIKRILAYSTISQLGYMMLALGSTGYVASVFHLATHAFFKALLFLTAGSVIHAMAGSQDITEMGGLWKKMRFTGPLFLIGAAALAGVPLLSGFFSKDEILVATWNDGNLILFVLALVTTFMTAFYMARVFLVVFWGEAKSELAEKAHEASNWMTWPLFVLAFFAIFLGYVNTPFKNFLGDWLVKGTSITPSHESGTWWIMLLAILLSAAGIYLAWEKYVRKNEKVMAILKPEGTVYRFVFNKYYLDQAYEMIVVQPLRIFSVFLSFVELILVKLINGFVPMSLRKLSMGNARAENGQVQRYGTFAFFGLAILVIVFAVVGGYFK